MILVNSTSIKSFFLSLFIATSFQSEAQLLLNEIVVNPPGADDPHEFIELKGNPGTTLSKIYVCVFEGDSASAGNCDLVIPLNNVTIGSNGLIFIGTTLGYPNIPAATTVKDTLTFGIPGGILENGNTTFAVLFSPIPIVYNADYDTNNDGVLDLPSGAVLQDAVGWTNGDLTAKIYGGVILTQSAGTPDAASRFYDNTTPFSKPAWYNGDITSLTAYDPLEISSNFPVGGSVTPGNYNTPNNGVGFNELSNTEFTVYPNPCSDRISLSGLNSEVPVRLFNATGSLVFSGKTNNGQVILPAKLSSGIYLLQTEINSNSVHRNISVIH